MQPRKPDETDAHYIARLEAAIRDTSAHNARMRKVQRRLFDAILPAAQQAGLVLQYAAEVTGMKDDAVVAHSVAALKKLSECAWAREDDVIVMPIVPRFPQVKAGFGGDVEMIAKSALERAKAFKGVFENRNHLYAKVPELGEDTDWQRIHFEISDALADFEFSRDMLRMDLRSAMYDYCFDRIREAVSTGYRRSERTQPYPPPFSMTTLGAPSDDSEVPF